jgi:hypothetical protein
MAIIDTGSVDPAMGNNRPAGSGAARAKNAAGADDGVGFGHRGHHRANRKDGGDCGDDCAFQNLRQKSPYYSIF